MKFCFKKNEEAILYNPVYSYRSNRTIPKGTKVKIVVRHKSGGKSVGFRIKYGDDRLYVDRSDLQKISAVVA